MLVLYQSYRPGIQQLRTVRLVRYKLRGTLHQFRSMILRQRLMLNLLRLFHVSRE